MFLTGQAFSFCPFVSKEKALSAENDILSGARDAEDVVPYNQ
jgi:hypothetical protein